MSKFLRWAGIALGIAVALALVALAYVYFASGRVLGKSYTAAPEPLGAATPAEIADAPRQARIRGCVHCHGEGLKGKKLFEVNGVGAVWSSNLTHSAATASDAQLAAAIRQGIAPDGRGLIAMPSPMYSRLSDGEVAALIAFIRSQPPDGAAVPKPSFGPLGRIAIVQGAIKPQPERIEDFRTRWPHELGPRFAAGRTLAAKTCSECHAPDLSGWTMENGTKAPDLAIVGGYDRDQFRTLLRTGRPPDGRDLGLMSEIAREDTRYMTDAEIDALHGYLQARAERVSQ